MKNTAIKVVVTPGQEKEVKQAAENIWKNICGAGVMFDITACALLGQLLGGCGCEDAGDWPKH